MTLIAGVQATTAEAHHLFLSGECQFFVGVCVFSTFLRGDGATACNLSFVTPVETSRPRFRDM
jgi:hypothetical protein